MKRPVQISLLLLGLLFLASCGGGPDVEALEREEKQAVETAVSEELDALDSIVDEDPARYPEVVARAELARVRLHEDDLVAKKTDALKSKAEKFVEELAEQHVQELEELTLEPLLRKGKVKEAEEAIAGIPSAFVAALPPGEIARLRQKVQSWTAAQKRHDEVLDKAERYRSYMEFETSIGTLESFLAVKAFRRSPFSDDVEAKLEEIQKEMENASDEVRWLTLFAGKERHLYKWSFNNPLAVKVEGNEIVVKTENEQVFMSMKDSADNWVDFLAKFDFKIVSGRQFGLAIRGRHRDRQLIPMQGYGTGNWYGMRVVVRGDDVVIVNLSDFSEQRIPAEMEMGSFGFLIPQNTELRLRSIYAKVFKKGELPETEEEEEEFEENPFNYDPEEEDE